jgi:Fur family ferric uptake transcriptional regulator
MSCESKFRKQLQERGLRLTSQRETILSVLHKFEAPATAEEVFDLARMENDKVDLSTVYRTLGLFQKLNIVSGFDPGDGTRRYEHVGTEQPHHHLVCRGCGCIITIPTEVIQPLTHQISTMHNFQIDPDGLTITGLCTECQQKA